MLFSLDSNVKYDPITLSNLLQAISFDIHPVNITNPLIQDILTIQDQLNISND